MIPKGSLQENYIFQTLNHSSLSPVLPAFKINYTLKNMSKWHTLENIAAEKNVAKIFHAFFFL